MSLAEESYEILAGCEQDFVRLTETTHEDDGPVFGEKPERTFSISYWEGEYGFVAITR